MSIFSQVLSPKIKPISEEKLDVPVVTEEVAQESLEENNNDVKEDPVTEIAEESLAEETTSNEVTVTIEKATGSVAVSVKKPRNYKSYQILEYTKNFEEYNNALESMKTSLQDYTLIKNFQTVAKTHNFSAPLVDAFRAHPRFDQAVKNFPESSLYNIVAEHKSSTRNVLGLESLEESEFKAKDSMVETAASLVENTDALLMKLVSTVDTLLNEVADAKEDLEESDITDEVLETLPVYTLSHDVFTEIFTKLHDYLQATDKFDTEMLRAYPEKMVEEIEALKKLVEELGPCLGMSLDEYGLYDCPKDDKYKPTPGSYGEKAISVQGLLFHLNQAESVLLTLKSLAERREEIVTALKNAVDTMPEAMETNDGVYGRMEHCTLMNCYTMLMMKLIKEALSTVAILLTTVDAAVNIDTGLPETSGEVVEVQE